MFHTDLLQALHDEQVEYVLVGGMAVMLHGYARSTVDVDLVLAMSDGNLQRFLKVARKLGLQPILPVKIEALCDASQLEAWAREKNMLAFALRAPARASPTIDVLVQPKIPFRELHEASVAKQVGAIRVPVASIDHLIALKSGTGRNIDAMDIAALEKIRSRGQSGS